MSIVATYGRIDDAERDLENRKRSYLQRWGWKETCSTPGSFWLWRRDFPEYGVITAGLDLAVQMTVRWLDEQPEIEDVGGGQA